MKRINWNWILDRLSENSTWRGIIGLATAAGAIISEQQSAKIIASGIALIGMINFFRKAPPTATEVAKAIDTGDTQHLVAPDINRPKIGPTTESKP